MHNTNTDKIACGKPEYTVKVFLALILRLFKKPLGVVLDKFTTLFVLWQNCINTVVSWEPDQGQKKEKINPHV